MGTDERLWCELELDVKEMGEHSVVMGRGWEGKLSWSKNEMDSGLV